MPAPRTLPIETPRLRLRAPAPDDLERLHEIYSDPRVAAWIGPHTREEVAAELAFQVEHQREHGFSLWSVEELATGRLIGDCGLQPLELTGPEIELGYDLHPDVWGQGYATEAARAALAHGLDELGLEEVVAVVKPPHRASRRVLEKAGLRPAGGRRAYGETLLLYAARRRDARASWRAP